MITKIILQNGADSCGFVETARLERYMNEKMRTRWEASPLPYAIAAVFGYNPDEGDKSLPMHARGGDYVAENKRRLSAACDELKRLYPDNIFLPRGNGWPLPIVQGARLAGLGQIGIHGLLITPGFGTAVTIGAVFTDFRPDRGYPDGGYCENCGACAAACPTGAIGFDKARFFIKEKCISYISQHVKEPSERERLWLRASGLSWGCDICQNACNLKKI